MLEEVNVEVDRRVDNGEKVGEVGCVLHPGWPLQMLLLVVIISKYILEYSEISPTLLEVPCCSSKMFGIHLTL